MRNRTNTYISTFTFFGFVLLQAILLDESRATEIQGGKIFKCTSKVGDVYYNDKPCPIEDSEKTLRSEKDVVDGYIPPSFKADKFVRRKGVVVGGGSSQTSVGGSSERISSSFGTEGNGSPAGSTANTSFDGQDKIVRTQEDGVGEMLPSNEKIEKRGPDGKFTIQEKKLMLGISPQIK